MPLPDTRQDLEDVGYKYSGSGVCRGCGMLMQWFDTPRGKKMPFSVVAGHEDSDPEIIEPHWGVCTKQAQFRREK